jgi:hypothetical protein
VAASEGSGERIIRTGPYPELTFTALIVGYLLGVLITISMGYACLILGFSHEGSELAAILGFGVLRGILRRNSIIENNISQTVASSVNGASAGVMFSVPALFILGRTDFNPYLLMVFSCIAGGILGIAFIIPLRKQMIDFERLTYPGGVAVATVLKSPGAGVHKAILLLIGIALSGTVSFISNLTGFENWALGQYIGMPDYMNGVWFISRIYRRQGRALFYHRWLRLLLGSGACSCENEPATFAAAVAGTRSDDARLSADFIVQAGRNRYACWRRIGRNCSGAALDYQCNTQYAIGG